MGKESWHTEEVIRNLESLSDRMERSADQMERLAELKGDPHVSDKADEMSEARVILQNWIEGMRGDFL